MANYKALKIHFNMNDEITGMLILLIAITTLIIRGFNQKDR